MRIFITGMAGFLGSRLAGHLMAKHEILGCDDFSAGEEANLPDVPCFHQDCKKDLAQRLQGTDVLIHCAAHPHEGLSVFSPRVICSSIYEASVSVFSSAIAAGVKRIIFCSSMSRYGRGMNQPPFYEHYVTAPEDPYAIAKVAAEQTLKSLSLAHQIEYVIAVPHNLVGENQKYDDPYRNVAAIMANRMLLGLPPIVYGDGAQTRCFSDVRDVLGTFEQMLSCPSGGVYNVGPDEQPVSIETMGKMLAEIIGRPWNPLRLPDRPLEVKHAYCSSDLIRSEFGYRTTYTLRETLESLVSYVRMRGPRRFNYYLPIEISKGAPKAWLNDHLDLRGTADSGKELAA